MSTSSTAESSIPPSPRRHSGEPSPARRPVDQAPGRQQGEPAPARQPAVPGPARQQSEPPPPSQTAEVSAARQTGLRLRAVGGSAAPAAAPSASPPHADAGPPDPEPLVTNLARCVVEVLAGARDLEQIARWVSDDVYRHLLKRVVLAARARSARGAPKARPTFAVGSVRITRPDNGVVEAVVVMHGRARSRAVALRLESMGTRWRATAVHVL